MLNDYSDIRSRIEEEPKWWDEYGVPRYCDFSHERVADIYANDCALVEIACQACQRRFLVAFSWSKSSKPLTVEDIKRLHYGDPPNACCGIGATMNCEDLRVVEFWQRGGEEFTAPDPNYPTGRICLPGYFEWRRVPELEIPIEVSP